MAFDLTSLVRGQARAAAKRAAIPVAFAILTGLFAMLATAGLFAILFFALEPRFGALEAAAIMTGGALVLALVASTPLWWPKQAPPPPPEPTLADFMAMTAKNAPALSGRQIALSAVLIALALGLMASKKKDEG